VLDEEDGNAVVGSPRGKQHISLVKCRFHRKFSQNDQADAERRPSAAVRSAFKLREQCFKVLLVSSQLEHSFPKRA